MTDGAVTASTSRSYRLTGAHVGVAVAAFGVAACFGVLQGLSIADFDFPWRGEALYYLSVTAHGVLMALVFTTFFIMGLGYLLARESLGRIVGRGFAWAGFWIALVGTGMAAATMCAARKAAPRMRARFNVSLSTSSTSRWLRSSFTSPSFR